MPCPPGDSAVIVSYSKGGAEACSSMTRPPAGSGGSGHLPGDGVVKSIGRSDAPLYGPIRDWMMSMELSSAAPGVGDTVPDFFLPDQEARLVSLANLLADGPIVLAFIGGGWCSFCLRRLRIMSQALRDGPARLVAITPETGRYPRAMKQDHKLDCMVLSDVDYGVGLLFGLIFPPPQPIVSQMASAGFDLARLHGVSKPMLPAPAFYVIDRSGKIAYAQVELDYTVAGDPAPVLDALAYQT